MQSIGSGVFAPAGELPLTVQAMFGNPAPSPVGLAKDQGASVNGLSRDAGAIGAAVGDAGIPSMTGGASPSMTASSSSLPNAGAKSVLDLSHPSPWMLLLAVGLLGLVHFNVGTDFRVRGGKS